jgi:hypothetical protein
MNTIIETIKNSKFSNDLDLQFSLQMIEEGNLSKGMIKILTDSAKKRLATLEANSVNLPTNLFNSYECELIEDYLLDNEWSKDDINDANAYKGKYYINDNTANEIKLVFFKHDNDLFVDYDGDLIQL